MITEKTIKTYGQNDTLLMCHVSHKVPGIDFSTGSLGHGLPVAAGLARQINKYISKKEGVSLIDDKNWM